MAKIDLSDNRAIYLHCDHGELDGFPNLVGRQDHKKLVRACN
jgi:hypothetical protein